jgi:hypothetical protein
MTSGQQEQNQDGAAAPGPGDSAGPGATLAFTGGHPGATEIAVVTALLTALSRPAEPAVPRPRPRPEWAARTRLMREPLVAGPGAWRVSGLPR